MAQCPPNESSQYVLVLQFSDRVPPAQLRVFLEQRSLPFHTLRVYEPFALPAYEAAVWRAMVVLGGPQGAYEDALHPYLTSVKALMAAQLQRATPMLGICLGCQLLAAVIGGSAFKAEQPELGYVAMRASVVGGRDPLIAALLPYASTGLFLEHHGDSFTLPPHVPLLLESDAHPQAFRYRSAVAVQFHPEAGLAEFSEWLKADSEERMQKVGRSKEDVLHEVRAKAADASVASREFFTFWWKEVEARETVAVV